jgi:hypothetical protein
MSKLREFRGCRLVKAIFRPSGDQNGRPPVPVSFCSPLPSALMT